jgi:tetraacyldisaccharide 4'-kinase
MNPALKVALAPLGAAYGMVTLLRNKLYDWRVLSTKRFEVHTIGVGNLAVGGAGKTPLIEYLIRLLLREGYHPATLSRGYKRKTSGFVLANDASMVDEIGDEPLMYKTKYNVSVAVDANRVKGIRNLVRMMGKQRPVILLDDVFQHRAVRCGLNILVTEYNNLYYNDTMLPAGTLREFGSGVKRADVIVVTKTPERTSAVDMRAVIKDIRPLAHQRVFFSYLKYGELYSITDPSSKLDTLNDLFRFRVIAFTGIANPSPMVNYLREYAADLKHLPFADHYQYQPQDLIDIERYYHKLEGGNKILVTTEKDLMRLKLPALWTIAKKLNIYILPVEVTFKDKEEEFNEVVLQYARSRRIYHEKYT